jgi:hypothetical protein
VTTSSESAVGHYTFKCSAYNPRHAKALMRSPSPGTCIECPFGDAIPPEVGCGVMHMDCHALRQLCAKLFQHGPRLTHLHESG